MTARPSSNLSKVHLDQPSDSPADARAEILAAVNVLNQIINSFGDPNGIATLDNTGRLTSGQRPSRSDVVNAASLVGILGGNGIGSLQMYTQAGNSNSNTLNVGTTYPAASVGKSSGTYKVLFYSIWERHGVFRVGHYLLLRMS